VTVKTRVTVPSSAGSVVPAFRGPSWLGLRPLAAVRSDWMRRPTPRRSDRRRMASSEAGRSRYIASMATWPVERERDPIMAVDDQ